MAVVIVGLNHRTVQLSVLERMTVSEEHLPKALDDLASRQHVQAAVVLSTCHRTEVYVTAERFHGAVQDARNFLSDLSGLPPEEFSDHLYTYYDEAAVAHLFGVASGLDSVVLGESEILGQVRRAWTRARERGAADAQLSALFRHAVETGKRARTETAIARNITSVSQAAVAMAAERLGDLTGRRVLVVGAGDMGESMTVALAGSGVAEVLVANRTRSRAEALARRVGGRALGLNDVPDALGDVDVLLTGTGANSLVFDEGDLEAAVARRADRPLLIVDVAVPRDIDPSVAGLDGVTLLDIDDLKAFVSAGLDSRRQEVVRVQALVAEEVERHLSLSVAREVAPMVTALRERAEAVRQAELERFRVRLDGLDDRQREAIEALTRGLLAKLLHEPTVRLKDAAGTDAGRRMGESLRQLFDL